MLTLGKPELYWDTPYLEQEYTRVHSQRKLFSGMKETHKTSYVRGWVGDKGAQYLMKQEWKEGEWENYKLVFKTFKEKVRPKGQNKEINTDLS